MRSYRIYASLFILTGPWHVAAQREHRWSTFDDVETPTSGILRFWLLAAFEACHHLVC